MRTVSTPNPERSTLGSKTTQNTIVCMLLYLIIIYPKPHSIKLRGTIVVPWALLEGDTIDPPPSMYIPALTPSSKS